MSKLSRCLPLLSLLWLAACSNLPPVTFMPSSPTPSAPVTSGAIGFDPVPVRALPDWPRQDLAHSAAALRQSCRVVASKPAWSAPCQDLATLDGADNGTLRQFFEAHFTAWRLHEGERDSGMITGYYEPALQGSRTRSDATPYPVYGVPADLVSFAVPAAARGASVLVARRTPSGRLQWVPGADSAAAGQITVVPADFADQRGALKGRIENGRLVPYYSRAEIAAGKGVNSAPVLAWVADPVELFFLQIQGAGRIRFDDGSALRVGVGDTNGLPYRSIGTWLAQNGEMPLSSASMSGIQSWVRAHPDRQQALFNVNPRYVFFRAQPEGNDGPVGSLGVPLTGGYSIAVDPHYIPLGTPVYLSTTLPMTQQPLTRLVNAQDTGSAIRGALRADFFWGYGDEAGANAGRMKQRGSLWLLLPNGVTPSI